MISKILTVSALTVVVTGRAEPFVISRDHKLFGSLLIAVNNKDEAEVLGIIDIANKVNEFSQGSVSIRNGQVFVGDEEVSQLIAERILELYNNGLDFEYMAKFLENLMQNPSFTSRQELYLFLENGDCPITDDGRFLAYKWVRDDYYDTHTGRFSLNKPGAVIKMERGKVDDRRENTCSYGLHVCTHAYTKFGERLMMVAVNPKDVVSVPSDYDNAKMRVSEYEVLFEVGGENDYVKMDGGIVSTQPREKNGRFSSIFGKKKSAA